MRDHMIVWTTESGGLMKVMWGSPEKYEQIKAERRLNLRPDEDEGKWIEPYYLALVKIEDDYDYGLGRSRQVASQVA